MIDCHVDRDFKGATGLRRLCQEQSALHRAEYGDRQLMRIGRDSKFTALAHSGEPLLDAVTPQRETGDQALSRGLGVIRQFAGQ